MPCVHTRGNRTVPFGTVPNISRSFKKGGRVCTANVLTAIRSNFSKSHHSLSYSTTYIILYNNMASRNARKGDRRQESGVRSQEPAQEYACHLWLLSNEESPISFPILLQSFFISTQCLVHSDSHNNIAHSKWPTDLLHGSTNCWWTDSKAIGNGE